MTKACAFSTTVTWLDGRFDIYVGVEPLQIGVVTR